MSCARGQISTSEGIWINRLCKRSGYNEQKTLFEEKYLLVYTEWRPTVRPSTKNRTTDNRAWKDKY